MNFNRSHGFVWEKIVADRAFVQLQTDESREAIDGFRIRLAELDLNAAKPSQAAEILDGIRAGDVDSLDALRALASQMETKRRFRLAALVYGRLFRTLRRVQANSEPSRR